MHASDPPTSYIFMKSFCPVQIPHTHPTSAHTQVRSVMQIIEKLNLDIIEIHNADFISDPKGTMRRVCHTLKITCSEEYLQMCALNVYKEVSKSRRWVQWWPDLIELAANKMKAFDHLRRYSLHSV